MQNINEECSVEEKLVDFGSVTVDSIKEHFVYITNDNCNTTLTYRITHMYSMDNIDRVFKTSITERAEVRILFKPQIPGQFYTEYFDIDDSEGNVCRLMVTGKCTGPEVHLDRKKITYRICKNLNEQRKETVNLINSSSVDTSYQWLVPMSGRGNVQIVSGNVCGPIRAHEKISVTFQFTGTALGIYTAELSCLVLHQPPLFLNVIATVILPNNSMYNIRDHVFEKNWEKKCQSSHLLENSLRKLEYIPPASVFERYLDFGTGSVNDVTLNISQTVSVTNHGTDDGYMQWMPDPENIFLIDPIASVIPPNESKLFTIRFRPSVTDDIYGFLLCGDFQHKKYYNEHSNMIKLKHTSFRIPCIGNTWHPCTDWNSQWCYPTEIVLPPTVPGRRAFKNFMVSNKLKTPMSFRFYPPGDTNFVILPMCGVVAGHGYQIITVALEPMVSGEYCENWDININRTIKGRISLIGSAEVSNIDVMSHGYHPSANGMYEFPPTITGCTNYCTAFFHNLTRMEIHVRVLNYVDWLGADNGSIILRPKEVYRYCWWFFPKTPNKVYQTTVTCSCVCLINGRPTGEPRDLLINLNGFSELPDLRVLPKSMNLHDLVVDSDVSFSVTLYNNCSCFYTSKLHYNVSGMEDDWNNEKFEIESPINSLKPSSHSSVSMRLRPKGAGPRQINIKYTVLFRTENDEIEEIQPIIKSICVIWYDGIYPTIKVKRTICVKCPVILSNHCVWNITNVDTLNKALTDCRPNKAVDVEIYAPDMCVRTGNVEIILVLACVYAAQTEWTLRREKICQCEMIEVQVGISTYKMKHTCKHRSMIVLTPLDGVVKPNATSLLHLKFNYTEEGHNRMCYVMTLPNQRQINLFINMYAKVNIKGTLTPLRRPVGIDDYLTILDCGKVPINNLDPVIRIAWIYNPSNVFISWRLLRGNTLTPDSTIRCLLYFAEVPPLGKFAIPFSFMPTEMTDYEVQFTCSFGCDTVNILVKGQGGLPNCIETRLDIPYFVEKSVRSAYREGVVYLSTEHITLPVMPTFSLTREIIAISNDTEHVMRYIWLPERVANILNVVMTPCWGVIQPKCSEWITMTVYSLQAPATFTTTVACEILDLTERQRYQDNDTLRRNKRDKCREEFIITEAGFSRPGINESPPYVLDMDKPEPYYLALSLAISSKGQRDGYPRMLLKQMWEQPPPYDLLSVDLTDYGGVKADRGFTNNNMPIGDIIRIIDQILWEALHSKMFKYHIEYYSKEEIPTYAQLVDAIENEAEPHLSRRVTSGICDAIVNKAVFHVYGLNTKHEVSILEAE